MMVHEPSACCMVLVTVLAIVGTGGCGMSPHAESESVRPAVLTVPSL